MLLSWWRKTYITHFAWILLSSIERAQYWDMLTWWFGGNRSLYFNLYLTLNIYLIGSRSLLRFFWRCPNHSVLVKTWHLPKVLVSVLTHGLWEPGNEAFISLPSILRPLITKSVINQEQFRESQFSSARIRTSVRTQFLKLHFFFFFFNWQQMSIKAYSAVGMLIRMAI